MKVLLTTLNTKYVHTNIALKYLYETIKNKENIEAELKEFTINEPVDKIFRNIAMQNADIVAFSVYIWNVEQTLVICENLKQLLPNIKIILGGPEVTYCSKELLEKYDFIDYIIIGEGEETFPKLINGEINSNVSYKQDDEIIVGTIGIVEDTKNIPCIANEIVKEYDGKIVYIETVRGCPYNCSYCLSSTIKGIRPFEMERVKNELLILMKAQVRLIKFVDRTFNYDKKRALEIWKFILENNISSEFHFEISAHLIDEEMLNFLETVPKGVFRLEIGVQSTNEETIKA
ncbi:MAG: B12-binding domain-containing radical SAM protein, partial [Clostridia bacterium]|nr:B12-binding domain-containing radical SAM protein [Clostridia bacterium]